MFELLSKMYADGKVDEGKLETAVGLGFITPAQKSSMMEACYETSYA